MKGQKKKHSFLEACLNIGIGFGIAMIANMTVLPLFGFHVDALASFHIALIYTVISVVRSYYVRRLFNFLHTKEIL